MKFKKVTLGEIVTILGDGIHGTPKYDSNGEYFFINGNNLENGKIIIKEDTKKVNESEYNKYKKKLNNRTILVSINGTLGNVAMYNNEKCILGKSACYFNVKEDVNKEFVKFILYTNRFKNFMQNYSTGTTIKNMSLKEIKNFKFELPNKSIQDKIVQILSKIDNKIELNNQINDNLHELINSIYYKYFEEESNLKYDKLFKYADCILGGTPNRSKKEYWNGNINWINSGEVNKFRILKCTEKITELGLKKSSTTIIPKESTVLAITGATLGQVSRLEIDTCTNQSVVSIVPKGFLTNEYIYLNILNNIEKIKMNSTGGAQQHINKGNVENYDIIIPSKEKMDEFNKVAYPIFSKININSYENLYLEQLRDTLLPKLMNGKIDLDKIEI